MLVPVIWKHEARPELWTEQSVVASGTIDKTPVNPNGALKKQEVSRAEQYRIVARALCAAESTFLRVGVPWLPSTERVRNLKCPTDLNPSQFVREEVVTVSTQVLESFCDDLETIGRDGVDMNELGLDLDSWVERYGFAPILDHVIELAKLWTPPKNIAAKEVII